MFRIIREIYNFNGDKILNEYINVEELVKDVLDAQKRGLSIEITKDYVKYKSHFYVYIYYFAICEVLN